MAAFLAPAQMGGRAYLAPLMAPSLPAGTGAVPLTFATTIMRDKPINKASAMSGSAIYRTVSL